MIQKYNVKGMPRILVLKGDQVLESFEGLTFDALIVSAIKQDEAHKKRLELKKAEEEKKKAAENKK